MGTIRIRAFRPTAAPTSSWFTTALGSLGAQGTEQVMNTISSGPSDQAIASLVPEMSKAWFSAA